MNVTEPRGVKRKVFRHLVKGKVRSVVELEIIPDIFGEKPAGYIHKVYTDKDYQNKGIATELILKAIKYAERAGCYKVFLLCQAATVPFYMRLGFKAEQMGMVHRID